MRIVVGEGSCGLAAGAGKVHSALAKLGADVGITGCIGMCVYEPIVEVYGKDGSHTTYVHVDPDKAVKILKQHIGQGEIVEEYTVNAALAAEKEA